MNLQREAIPDMIARPAAVDLCRRALAKSVLIKAGTHWVFYSPAPGRLTRHRAFNCQTVNALIAAGDAVRDGNIVRAA
jgi:hypothetical protein